jgi:hypothetical protein
MSAAMVLEIQSNFSGDPINGTAKANANGIGRFAASRANMSPALAAGPGIGDLALISRHAAAEVRDQLSGRHLAAWVCVGGGLIRSEKPDAPVVAAKGAFRANVIGELLVAHGDQEPEQVCGAVEIVLSQGGADKEAGEDRLGDVGGIKNASQTGIGEADAGGPLDGRLVLFHQLPGGFFVPVANPADQFLEGAFVHRLAHRTGKKSTNAYEFYTHGPGGIAGKWMHCQV